MIRRGNYLMIFPLIATLMLVISGTVADQCLSTPPDGFSFINGPPMPVPTLPFCKQYTNATCCTRQDARRIASLVHPFYAEVETWIPTEAPVLSLWAAPNFPTAVGKITVLDSSSDFSPHEIRAQDSLPWPIKRIFADYAVAAPASFSTMSSPELIDASSPPVLHALRSNSSIYHWLLPARCRVLAQAVTCAVCSPEIGTGSSMGVCVDQCESWLDACADVLVRVTGEGHIAPCTHLQLDRMRTQVDAYSLYYHSLDVARAMEAAAARARADVEEHERQLQSGALPSLGGMGAGMGRGKGMSGMGGMGSGLDMERLLSGLPGTSSVGDADLDPASVQQRLTELLEKGKALVQRNHTHATNVTDAAAVALSSPPLPATPRERPLAPLPDVPVDMSSASDDALAAFAAEATRHMEAVREERKRMTGGVPVSAVIGEGRWVGAEEVPVASGGGADEVMLVDAYEDWGVFAHALADTILALNRSFTVHNITHADLPPPHTPHLSVPALADLAQLVRGRAPPAVASEPAMCVPLRRAVSSGVELCTRMGVPVAHPLDTHALSGMVGALAATTREREKERAAVSTGKSKGKKGKAKTSAPRGDMSSHASDVSAALGELGLSADALAHIRKHTHTTGVVEPQHTSVDTFAAGWRSMPLARLRDIRPEDLWDDALMQPLQPDHACTREHTRAHSLNAGTDAASQAPVDDESSTEADACVLLGAHTGAEAGSWLLAREWFAEAVVAQARAAVDTNAAEDINAETADATESSSPSSLAAQLAALPSDWWRLQGQTQCSQLPDSAVVALATVGAMKHRGTAAKVGGMGMGLDMGMGMGMGGGSRGDVMARSAMASGDPFLQSLHAPAADKGFGYGHGEEQQQRERAQRAAAARERRLRGDARLSGSQSTGAVDAEVEDVVDAVAEDTASAAQMEAFLSGYAAAESEQLAARGVSVLRGDGEPFPSLGQLRHESYAADFAAMVRHKLTHNPDGWTWDQRLLYSLNKYVLAPVLAAVAPLAVQRAAAGFLAALLNARLHSDADGPEVAFEHILGMRVPLFALQEGRAKTVVLTLCTIVRLSVLFGVVCFVALLLAVLVGIGLRVRTWIRARAVAREANKVGYEANEDKDGNIEFDYAAYARKMGGESETSPAAANADKRNSKAVGGLQPISRKRRMATLQSLLDERTRAVGDQSHIDASLPQAEIQYDSSDDSDSDSDSDADAGRKALWQRMGLGEGIHWRQKGVWGAGHVLGNEGGEGQSTALDSPAGARGRSVLLDKYSNKSGGATKRQPTGTDSTAMVLRSNGHPEDEDEDDDAESLAAEAEDEAGGMWRHYNDEFSKEDKAEIAQLKAQYLSQYKRADYDAQRPSLDVIAAWRQQARSSGAVLPLAVVAASVSASTLPATTGAADVEYEQKTEMEGADAQVGDSKCSGKQLAEEGSDAPVSSPVGEVMAAGAGPVDADMAGSVADVASVADSAADTSSGEGAASAGAADTQVEQVEREQKEETSDSAMEECVAVDGEVDNCD